MSADIVAIHGTNAGIAVGKAEPTVVEMLEKYLEEARRGEIIAVGLVIARPNNRVSFPWRCPGHSGHLIVAGCEYLKHDLLCDALKVGIEGDAS